jgi:hypothetical protein
VFKLHTHDVGLSYAKRSDLHAVIHSKRSPAVRWHNLMPLMAQARQIVSKSPKEAPARGVQKLVAAVLNCRGS